MWSEFAAEETGHCGHQEQAQDEERVEQDRQLQEFWTSLECSRIGKDLIDFQLAINII